MCMRVCVCVFPYLVKRQRDKGKLHSLIHSTNADAKATTQKLNLVLQYAWQQFEPGKSHFASKAMHYLEAGLKSLAGTQIEELQY